MAVLPEILCSLKHQLQCRVEGESVNTNLTGLREGHCTTVNKSRRKSIMLNLSTKANCKICHAMKSQKVPIRIIVNVESSQLLLWT